MTQKTGFLQSTIGRKQVVALTGAGLSLFVLSHMLGNMLLLVSAQAYNEYSHALISNKLIYVAELGLAAIFLAHIFFSVYLQIKNKAARPERYAVQAKGYKATSPVSKTLAVQGILIFVFVVSHLRTFKFGPYYEVNYGQGPVRDLYRLVAEIFATPGYIFWYSFSMVVLGLHLAHGIKSMAQTMGANHPKYQKCIKCASYGYAVLVAVGFLIQPLYMFFFHKGG